MKKLISILFLLLFCGFSVSANIYSEHPERYGIIKSFDQHICYLVKSNKIPPELEQAKIC